MKPEVLIVGEYTIAKLRAGEEVTVSGVTLIPASDLMNKRHDDKNDRFIPGQQVVVHPYGIGTVKAGKTHFGVLVETSDGITRDFAAHNVKAYPSATLPLRDQLAAAALPAIYAQHTMLTDAAAALAYEQADEMLKVRRSDGGTNG